MLYKGVIYALLPGSDNIFPPAEDNICFAEIIFLVPAARILRDGLEPDTYFSSLRERRKRGKEGKVGCGEMQDVYDCVKRIEL